MSRPAPLVYALVLNWNGEAATRRAVASLAAQDHPNLKVLIVDNGSADGSAQALADAGEVLEVGANLGFAGGMNRGAAEAIKRGAAYVLLVNNDAVLAPDAARLLAGAGFPIAAPTIVQGLPPAEAPLWYAGGSVSAWTGEATHHDDPPAPGAPPKPVSFASGCCLLVDAAAWRMLGGLDEGYFLYHEDVDFCLRAKRAGLPIGWVPAARAWHEGGASTGSQAAKAPALDYYDARNGLRVVRTRLGPLARPVGWYWWLNVRLPRKLARIALRGPAKGASLRAALRGAWDGVAGRTGPAPEAVLSPRRGEGMPTSSP